MVSSVRRRLSCYISARFFHACVVGSGPSGCYTAEKLLKRFKDVNVDVIERLPTPFGLLRYGVAPDHPETKVVTNQFSRIFENERCSFFGNVSLGKDVHLSELRKLYHVVVLAYGAEDDKVLGIPAESLTGIHSAREFVWWYNGHPDYSSLAVDLQSTDTAVVLGMGNVALDVARVLLRPLEELCSTDIAEHAWSALQRSCIRRVYLVGRRGPVQAACTAKELREILGLKGLSLEIKDEDLVTSSLDEEEMERSRSKKRVYELFCKASKEHASSKSFSEKKLHFVFFRKPERFLSSICKSKVAGIRLEKTVLKGDDSSGHQSAIGTGEFEEIECGLVLKSIGYKARLEDEFPFDFDTGGRIPVRGSYEAADNMTGPSFPYAYQPNIAYAPYQYPSYFPEILYGPNIYNPYVMPQYPQMFAASAASSPAIYSYGPSPAFVAPHAMSFQNSGAVQYGNQSDSSVTSVPPTHYAFASALQTGLIPPTIAAGQSLAQLRMPTQTQTGEDILEEAHSGSLAGIH